MSSRPSVAVQRIFYVYFWIDPVTQIPFYVGKGMENRAFFKHRHQRCQNKLNKLLANGHCIEDIAVIHKDNLTEDEAYALEEQYIATYKRVEEGGTLFNYRISRTNGYRKIIDPAVIEKICKLYFEDGMNAKDVGKIIGIHETSVLRWIKESGRLTFHSGLREPFGSNVERSKSICEEYKNGLPTPFLAKKYKCCVPTILSVLRRNGVEVLTNSKKTALMLSADNVRKDIVEMYAQRVSQNDIAKKYKTATNMVKAVLCEMGVQLRCKQRKK